MKRICLLVIGVLFSINSNAQAPDWLWAKAMESAWGDWAHSITADGDGNLYTIGRFTGTVDFDPGVGVFNITSNGGTTADIFICKTDSAGNFIWAKAVGGPSSDYGSTISFDPSGAGAVYFSGYFQGIVDFDPNAGVFNLGSVIPGYSSIFICKLDTAGNLIWAKEMGGSGGGEVSSLTIDPSGSGNIYCTGNFGGTSDFDPDSGIFNLTSAGNSDIFVSKYNSAGNLIWAKRIGGLDTEFSQFIARCPAGNTDVYITGYFFGAVDFDPGAGTHNLISAGLNDIFIEKLDSAGNFVWAKRMGGADGDFGGSIALDISGNVYTTGHFGGMADFDPGTGTFNLTSAGFGDIFISKLDSSGNFVWAKRFGGGDFDIGYDMVIDYSGNAYTVGYFHGTVDFDPGIGVSNITSAGFSDIFVLAFDNAGNFDWVKRVGGTEYDDVFALVLDPTGHLTMTGKFDSPTIAFGTTTLSTGGQSAIYIARLDTILTTGIETISNDPFPIYIYPNPFTEVLTVGSSEPVEIKIFDITGRIVYTQKLSSFNAQRITTNWQKGIYFVEVISDKGRVVKKVVKY